MGLMKLGRSIQRQVGDTLSTFCNAKNIWPSAFDIIIAFVLALLVIIVDIVLASKYGLIANPGYHDGITYMLMAKSAFYRADLWGSLNCWELAHAPLWVLSMMVNMALFGDGIWQLYAARFWPIFLFFVLVLWLIRRHSDRNFALIVVTVTAFLPIISVCGRGLISFFSIPGGIIPQSFYYSVVSKWLGDIGLGMGGLGDLRPDLLFAILLLWAIVPLIENAKTIDNYSYLISGIFAGLAMMTKPTATLELFCAWGLAFCYVIIINKGTWIQQIKNSVFSLLPFIVIVTPWVFAGGIGYILNYFSVNTNAAKVLNIFSGSFIDQFLYFFRIFPYLMGDFETLLLVGIFVIFIIYILKFGITSVSSHLLGYGVIIAALYLGLSINPFKNIFMGLTFYVIIWVVLWEFFAQYIYNPLIKVRPHISKVSSLLCISYLIVMIVMVGYGVSHVPPNEFSYQSKNNIIMQQIGTDLRHEISNSDYFLSILHYGQPTIVLYYMVDNHGQYPQNYWLYDMVTYTPDSFANEAISKDKAILVYNKSFKDIPGSYSDVRTPYFEAVRESVVTSSEFKLIRQYPNYTIANSPMADKNVSIDLYLKT